MSNFSSLSIPILLFVLFVNISAFDDYSFTERLAFHKWICGRHPELYTCKREFTHSMFESEKERIKDDWDDMVKRMKRSIIDNGGDNRNKRSFEDEDDDYEYYMWRKYQRAKLRRKLKRLHALELAEADDNQGDTTIINNHYYQRPAYSYRPTYGGYSPSSYSPGYGSYGGYPGYGGYGGYGGGQVFNLGWGSGLGIGTPIGGFGIGHFFNIGVG